MRFTPRSGGHASLANNLERSDLLTQALIFLLQTFLGLFSFALLLRFLLQAVRARVGNPISQFVNALTDFIVIPARRFIPGLWGLDLSTLVLAWVTEFILLIAVYAVQGISIGSAGGLIITIILAAVSVFRMFIYILIGALIVQAVISWFVPDSPLRNVANAITRPLLRPFQRLIPPVGNVDLSPLFAIIACQLVLMLVSGIVGQFIGATGLIR